jgi:NAD(P)-dependent dehydrogenase (short-subunit alcohol dehydrogenase family)
MLDQHVWTTWYLLQAFVPHLAASGRGRVIVVSTPMASRPAAKTGAYAAAKAAEEALILTLAQETKDQGVTANILQVRAIDIEHKREKEPSPANAAWATPEEIAAAMLYLCSDEAGVVNGARLPLFGSGI